MKPHIKLKTKKALSVVPFSHYQANQEAIDLAIDLVEKCSTGEIIGVAIAGVMSDGCITTTFSPTNKHWQLVGALEKLKHRMVK